MSPKLEAQDASELEGAAIVRAGSPINLTPRQRVHSGQTSPLQRAQSPPLEGGDGDALPSDPRPRCDSQASGTDVQLAQLQNSLEQIYNHGQRPHRSFRRASSNGSISNMSGAHSDSGEEGEDGTRVERRPRVASGGSDEFGSVGSDFGAARRDFDCDGNEPVEFDFNIEEEPEVPTYRKSPHKSTKRDDPPPSAPSAIVAAPQAVGVLAFPAHAPSTHLASGSGGYTVPNAGSAGYTLPNPAPGGYTVQKPGLRQPPQQPHAQQQPLQLQLQQQLQQPQQPGQLQQQQPPKEYRHGHVPKNLDLAQEFHDKQQQGHERAPTTLMIRNIPNRYTQNELILELEALGFASTFDFLYVPLDKGTMSNVGYAFVNFVDPSWATKCMEAFHGYHFKRHRKVSGKIAAVSIAHIQGLEANLAHYKNAAVNTAKMKQRRPLVMANISRSLVSALGFDDAPGAGGGGSAGPEVVQSSMSEFQF